MEANELIELSKNYESNKEYIVNEETTKMALIVPFLRLLGYNPNNPIEVRSEFTAPFTEEDGKRLKDRMDYAIFDSTGKRPFFVVEAKPLGTDVRLKSPQLARYIAQLEGLRFGIITDGCNYFFYGDLVSPNMMDQKAFFSFSLSDPKEDWVRVAAFLDKFSRGKFNAETLVIDAENSRYKREIVDKLAKVLGKPGEDEEFLKWLTSGIYKGPRTRTVMERLAHVAEEAVEPALLRVLGTGIANKIKERFDAFSESEESAVGGGIKEDREKENDNGSGESIESAEKDDVFNFTRQICIRSGHLEEDFIERDTQSYLNISFKLPTKWFLRYFTSSRSKSIVTLVPVEEARTLAHGFEVETAPAASGISRIYIEHPAQVWALHKIVSRSLELLQTSRTTITMNKQEVPGSEESGPSV
ncbi:MAG: type I restriction enzyme HsdR N-terminal domain-containing protein [Planctomycetes bacterium]|nr:type I restriction enzyme HsdR N-terminal domain-containing protein [Planctomycetota bacterium]